MAARRKLQFSSEINTENHAIPSRCRDSDVNIVTHRSSSELIGQRFGPELIRAHRAKIRRPPRAPPCAVSGASHVGANVKLEYHSKELFVFIHNNTPRTSITTMPSLKAPAT